MRSAPGPVRHRALSGGSQLAVTNVTMLFDGFAALSRVSLTFEPGLVHVIVGQNGAGKTTLSRIMAGLYHPTEGTVSVGDVRLAGDVIAARRQGVDMVHQNFSLPPTFTVAEALHLFTEAAGKHLYRRKHLERQCQKVLDELGPNVAPSARIKDLSVEARQGLEITRALSGRTRVLILDEPTAALSPDGVSALFDRVRNLAASGVTVLVILHKLDEVWGVADTVTVLRDGQVAFDTTPLTKLTRDAVTHAIIGEETSISVPAVESAHDGADNIVLTSELRSDVRRTTGRISEGAGDALVLAGITTLRSGGDAGLTDVALTVKGGEVVGVAGVEGNGQRTLVEAVCGLTKLRAGRVSIDGRDVTRSSLLSRRRLGLRVIPFDRNAEGVSLTSPIWLNVGVGDVLGRRSWWTSPKSIREDVQSRVDHWGVKFRSLSQNVGELSGGNVQRAILAREVSDGARIVVAAQPTRGLDLAATAFVHATLDRLAREGIGVLLISTDLDELRSNCDRIVVLRAGRLVADLPPHTSLLQLGTAMVGGMGHA